MQRASVDFPQPVSPTRPSVSPRNTSRSTPSTACTCSWLRRKAEVDCTGKYFFRPLTLTSTSPSGAAPGSLGTPTVTTEPSWPARGGQLLAHHLVSQGG